ncbi:MAG TPA: cyclodeaminase/cyclohydrolase family protein [Spirochaetota bacterium]|nr:cyclodeaminase/cyclohydrolase family protein [Spirochaetota bacterium]HOL56439.1 cyclodeaminase/cyclohydrolase family protein [Spirochaetota bacterium]HPP04455.1 cyclodeaminase/cyclohydrolase family protein [Spirochaetota bacterium]
MDKDNNRHKEDSFVDFCNKLGSDKPVPGGGAASGIVLSLAASCAEKAARFSIDNYLEHYLNSFIEIKEKGFILAENDQKAFLNWMQARKLPKDTESEKKEREEKIEKYVKESASVPLEIAKNCIKLVEIILDFIPYCNKWLVSDLATAVAFACASFESSLFNIRINIPYIKDNDFILSLKLFIEKNEKYFQKIVKNSLRSCNKKIVG